MEPLEGVSPLCVICVGAVDVGEEGGVVVPWSEGNGRWVVSETHVLVEALLSEEKIDVWACRATVEAKLFESCEVWFDVFVAVGSDVVP
jgi:hypothetical protein